MIRVRFYIGEVPEMAGGGPSSWSAHRERARALAAVLTLHGIQGATLYPSLGLWEGRLEAATVVEVLATTLGGGKVREIATALRAAFDQDTVLYTVEYPGRDFAVEARFSDRSGVDHA